MLLHRTEGTAEQTGLGLGEQPGSRLMQRLTNSTPDNTVSAALLLNSNRQKPSVVEGWDCVINGPRKTT